MLGPWKDLKEAMLTLQRRPTTAHNSCWLCGPHAILFTIFTLLDLLYSHAYTVLPTHALEVLITLKLSLVVFVAAFLSSKRKHPRRLRFLNHGQYIGHEEVNIKIVETNLWLTQ